MLASAVAAGMKADLFKRLLSHPQITASDINEPVDNYKVLFSHPTDDTLTLLQKSAVGMALEFCCPEILEVLCEDPRLILSDPYNALVDCINKSDYEECNPEDKYKCFKLILRLDPPVNPPNYKRVECFISGFSSVSSDLLL